MRSTYRSSALKRALRKWQRLVLECQLDDSRRPIVGLRRRPAAARPAGISRNPSESRRNDVSDAGGWTGELRQSGSWPARRSLTELLNGCASAVITVRGDTGADSFRKCGGKHRRNFMNDQHPADHDAVLHIPSPSIAMLLMKFTRWVVSGDKSCVGRLVIFESRFGLGVRTRLKLCWTRICSGNFFTSFCYQLKIGLFLSRVSMQCIQSTML